MIGLSGISLGGYLTSLVASLDDLACAILGVPAVDLVDLVDRHAGSHPHDPVRQTIRLAKPIGRMMSPFALTPRVPMQGRFIDAGVADRLVHPREQVTRLGEHWGKPEIHWYQGDPTVAARWYSLASRQKFKASRGSAPRCGISGACTAIGTRVSAMFVRLGEPGATMLERIHQVVDSVATAKKELGGMSTDAAMTYAVGLVALAGLGPSTHLDRVGHPACNLVISNVAGTTETRYLNGARLLGIYPVSALAASIGLNATLASYHDSIDFGFVANAAALDDLPQLAHHTLQAYEELKEAA